MGQNNRRKFIGNLGLGAASAFLLPGVPGQAETGRPRTAGDQSRSGQRQKTGRDTGGTSLAASMESIQLNNGVQLQLLSNEEGFLGIGEVRIGPTLLRDGKLPLFCEIRNPEGILIDKYPVAEKTVSPDRIRIKMSAVTRRIPVMEYMIHTVRNRENLYVWADEPEELADTFVTLEIFPVNRSFGSYLARGFSYRYTFESKTFPVYKIVDHGTWEIDGHGIGNECWQRVGHVPSIVKLETLEQPYSTENYMKGIANPNIFQFLPLQTELQGFTFLAHGRGVQVTLATEIAHVRTLLEKPRGEDRIFHFHQHCGDLSYDFVTSPMEVLWLDRPGTNRVDRANIYEAVRTVVHDQLHKAAGIRPEKVSPYGMIEQWTVPDFDKYTNVILPQFIEKGVRRLFLPNEFQNVMNTWGLSNMCCNVDFKFSEAYGGVEKIKRFCAKALEAGISVDMWGNTALSTLTEMFQWRDGQEQGIKFLPKKDSIDEVLERSRDPWVRNASNALEADHYAPRFAVMNLRDPDIRAYWMQQWKMAYDAGIRGIFLDSSFNMSSDKFHFIQNTDRHEVQADDTDPERFYRPARPAPSAILTQYTAHLEWVREMQEIGISYCGEDLGVFGVHRHGPDLDMYLDCMPLFLDSFMDFDERLVKKAGQDPLPVFFKGLAYRIMWMMKWDFKRDTVSLGIEDPRAFAFFRAFDEVGGYMQQREILPDEKAIKYSALIDGTKVMVYWVLEQMTIDLPGMHDVTEIISKKRSHTKTIEASPLSIYIIK